jgi:UDP-glucose 4-epimerase
MYRVATGQYEKLSVWGNDYPTPDGSCIRDYLHVVDLAQAHLNAFEYLAQQQFDVGLFNPINLGTGTGTSVLEMIALFEEVIGKSLSHVI